MALTSAHAFIRALKAAADPPPPESRVKIELATEAWHTSSLYIPSKDEILVEWLLAQISKASPEADADTPLVDVRYWQLLGDILVQATDKSVRQRLSPVVQKVPIVPILTAYFVQLAKSHRAATHELSKKVARCLDVLWPWTVAKARDDALLDAFWTLLRVCLLEDGCSCLEPLNVIVAMLLAQVRKLFASSTSKRKICGAFVADGHLYDWAKTLTRCTCSSTCALHGAIFDVVADIIFSQDGIRTLFLDDKSDVTAFAALAKNDSLNPPVFAQIWLPRWLSSFAIGAKRHKATLLTDGGKDALQSASSTFFRQCSAYLASYPSGQRWPAFVALLRVIKADNLYRRGGAWTEVFNSLAEEAVQHIDDATFDSSESPISVLTELLLLDFDLVNSILPKIMKSIPFVQVSRKAHALEFLLAALDYAGRTRTVESHTLMVMDSVSSTMNALATAQSAYSLAMRGALMDPQYAEALHNAVTLFLSPGQASHLMDELLARLRRDVLLLKSSLETGATKSKKSAARPVHTGCAIRLQYASSILCSAISRGLSRAGGPSYDTALENFEEVLNDLSAILAEHWSEIGREWELGTLQASSIRCRHMLAQVSSSKRARAGLATLVERLYEQNSDVLDLRVELDHAMLFVLPDLPPSTARHNVDTLLQRLEEHLDADTEWSEKVGALVPIQDVPRFAATAAWSLLLLRWLHNFLAVAQQDAVSRLVRLSFKIYGEETASTKRYTARRILHAALSDASFWEHRPVAVSIAEQLLAETSCYANLQIDELIQKGKGKKRNKKNTISKQQTQAAANAFRFVLTTPTTVLGRHARELLAARSCAADILLPFDEAELRRGIRKCIAYQAEFETNMSGTAVLFFVDTANLGPSPPPELVSATLQLAAVLFEKFLFAQETIKCLSNHFVGLFNTPGTREVTSLDIQLLVAFLKHVTELKHNNELAKDDIRQLVLTLTGYVDRFSAIPEIGNVESFADLLSISGAVLQVTRHLNLDVSISRGLVAKNFKHIDHVIQVKTPHHQGLAVAATSLLALDILFEPERSSTFVAEYITSASRLAPAEVISIDEPLKHIFKSYDVRPYEALLDSLRRAFLALSCAGTEDVRWVLRLARLVAGNAPEGVFKLVRRQTRFYLSACVNGGTLDHPSAAVRLEALQLVEQTCRERPISLQLTELGDIWMIFGRILAPTSVHDDETTHAFFQSIVSALTVVVRLRQDLILATFPHFTYILRRLVFALQSPRPQLGSRQLREVTDQLPRFVTVQPNGTGCLGLDSARSLARLFSAIIAKSTTAHRAKGTETTSLARPFTHHSPAILLAYLTVLSGPLGMLPLEMRNELEPGIFALCAACGDRGRDSIMAGTAGTPLDASGKTIFKTLWKEYEKQNPEGYFEQEYNFREFESIFASKSKHVLTAEDLTPDDMVHRLATLGQYAEIAHSTVDVPFVLSNIDVLSQPGYPLETYDALKQVRHVRSMCSTIGEHQGYCATIPDEKTVVLGFSGTAHIAVAFRLSWIWKERFVAKTVPRNARLHAGFQKVYAAALRTAARDALKDAFEQLGEVETLIITGHSLGGTMAQFMLLEILEDVLHEGDEWPWQRTPPNIILAAFGSPRPGNKSFKTFYASRIAEYHTKTGKDLRHWSVVGHRDGVPAIPPGFVPVTSVGETFYLYHGDLYNVPVKEAKHSVFKVVRDESRPARFEQGGHNYYSARDMERLIHRLRAIRDDVEAGMASDEWRRRYQQRELEQRTAHEQKIEKNKKKKKAKETKINSAPDAAKEHEQAQVKKDLTIDGQTA
ncbi:Urb2/Npa2 family-domain-containing protein [Auriculariales sp. MPI-PUGE-AT-0066]|nr:Urb2/Npa2 family-domain-containing protein [Auriculariales sp. MPI-PUGE-AT-0066]